MTNIPQKYNDCYFFYYSSCNKGPRCPYRHASKALGSENVCELWKDGKCLNYNCEYRHMDTQHKNREVIPCYWENQPKGCLKIHCPFSHKKPRPNEQSANLILPLKVPEIKITAPNSVVSKPISTPAGPRTEVGPAANAPQPQHPSHLTFVRPNPLPGHNHLHANTGIKDDSFHLSIKLDDNSDDETSPVREVPKQSIHDRLTQNPPNSTRPQLKPRNIQDRLGAINKKTPRTFDNNQQKKNQNAKANVQTIHIKTLEEIRRERAAQQCDSFDSSKENKLHKRTRDDVENEEHIQQSVNQLIPNDPHQLLPQQPQQKHQQTQQQNEPLQTAQQQDHVIQQQLQLDDIIHTEALSSADNTQASATAPPSQSQPQQLHQEQQDQPLNKKMKLESSENHLDFIDDILGSDSKAVIQPANQSLSVNDNKSNDWMKADFPELFDI